MRYRKKEHITLKRFFLSAFGCLLAAGCLWVLLVWTGKENPENTNSGTEICSQIESETAEEEMTQEKWNTAESFAADERVQEVSGQAEDSKAVEAAFIEQESQRIQSLSAGELAAEGIVREALYNRLFYAGAINEAILERIQGKSYTPNENIALSELSYLRMLYYGTDGNTYVGEMIVNQAIEETILEIFQTLYENQYPIERMVLVDEYNADDETSMENNNTSAFHYRTIAGSSKLSNHSYGMAIDLNPKYNPYVKTLADGSLICQPQGSYAYADRSKEFACKIDREDLAYRLFTQAGFTWGGDWNSVKDYQHFEMEK